MPKVILVLILLLLLWIIGVRTATLIRVNKHQKEWNEIEKTISDKSYGEQFEIFCDYVDKLESAPIIGKCYPSFHLTKK